MKVAIDGVMRAQISPALPQVPAERPRPSVRPQMANTGVVGMDGIRRRPAMVAAAAVAAPVVAVIPEPQAAPLPQVDPRRLPWKQLVAGVAASALVMGGAFALRHVRSENLDRKVASAQIQTISTAHAAATTTPSTAAAQAAINAAVHNFAISGANQTGVVVLNLKTGATATANPDQVFTSASLYKLFVAEAVYRGIDNGTIQPGQIVAGTGRNVQDCLNLMITISDNTCGERLGSLVGWDSQINRLHSAGYTHTLLRKNDSEQTSASDVALLLKRLYDGTLLSPNSSQAFIGLLKAQKVNNRLPQGLPAGTVIAHKTGDLNDVVHDAGIVYDASGDYLIAALSSWTSPGNAPAAFAKLSADVHAGMQAK